MNGNPKSNVPYLLELKRKITVNYIKMCNISVSGQEAAGKVYGLLDMCTVNKYSSVYISLN